MDIEEILKRRSPPTVSIRLPLDQKLMDSFKHLEREAGKTQVAAERTNDREVHLRAQELNRQLESMREQIEDSRATFVFQGIGRLEYNELLEQHPPRPEDKEGGFEFNPETFGPAIIAACAVEPELTLEQVEHIWRDWTDAECVKLFNAAYESNKVVRDVPFTVAGIATTRPSGPNSDSATGSE